MVYHILKKLLTEGRLMDCSIIIFHKNAVRNRKTIFGRDITGITRSDLKYIGGESFQEKLTVPLESVLEIECCGQTLFRKKKRIEKVYPRA